MNPGEVSVLAGLLVLLSESLHVSLQGHDDHVELLYLVCVLLHQLLLLLLLQVVFVEFGFGLVSLVDLELKHVIVVLDGLVLLPALVL